jgi:hypothetical protein
VAHDPGPAGGLVVEAGVAAPPHPLCVDSNKVKCLFCRPEPAGEPCRDSA